MRGRMRVLLGGFVVSGVVGCLPMSDFGDGSGTTGFTGPGEGMSATSNVGVTGTGGVTSEGTSSSSSSSSGGSMPTTGESTMCGAFGCEADLPLECDSFAQECPEGQKCAPVITDGGGNWDSARCVPVLGTDGPGDPCTAKSVADGLDSCAEGVLCWGVDIDGNGTCVAQCGGDQDMPVCPDNGKCTSAQEYFLNLCLSTCDPLLQDCAEGAACHPIDDGFMCAPDASGEMGKANDPCEFVDGCDAGLICGDAMFVGAGCPQGSMGCCTPFCGFPDGVCPNPDQECVQWFDPAMLPPGDSWLAIGACGVPS